MLLLQDQQTPLHWSSMNGRVVIVNMLLSHGADIHVTDKVIKYYDCSYYITNDCYDMIIIQHHSDVLK